MIRCAKTPISAFNGSERGRESEGREGKGKGRESEKRKAMMVDPVEWGLELSRYIHLNPVRVRALVLGKLEQAAGRVAAGEKPSKEIVQERLEKLRKYRWSLYRCYADFPNIAEAAIQKEDIVRIGIDSEDLMPTLC